jgi:hypothetical protein
VAKDLGYQKIRWQPDSTRPNKRSGKSQTDGL